LGAAGAATVDLDLAQVQGVDGVEDEMNQMIGGHPLAQIGWEEQGVSRSTGTKLVAMPFRYAQPRSCSNGWIKNRLP
jgi:hypothetical protein